MKLLILVAIIAAASAVSNLGSKKCSWGPAYWCQSYKEAEECRAIEHCQKKVWITKPEDDCVDCEAVVNELKSILSKNTTQHKLIVYLEDFCDKFGGQMAPKCKALVDTYAPEILGLFLLSADAKQVCASLRLCATKEKSTIVAAILKNSIPRVNLVSILQPGPVLTRPVKKPHPVKKSDNTALCVLCEFVMRELDNLVSENSTQKEIENALDKVCSFLPGDLTTECTEFVNEYAPAILEILTEAFNPSLVCRTLHLCTYKKLSKPVKKLNIKVAVPTCSLCEFVISELKNIMSENSTEEEIKNALERVCSFLPSTVKGKCVSFIDDYEPQLIQLLLQLKPDEVCTALGLCKSTRTLKVIQPVEKKVGKPVSVQSSVKCVVCEFIMDKLEAMLNQKPTEDEIRKALDKVCSLLPSSISADCKSFVDEYAAEVIKFLTDDFQPKKVCTMLGICTKETHPVATKVTVKSNETCSICKLVVTFLKVRLNTSKTEDEIIKEALELCSFLPGQIKPECTSLINEYGKKLLDLFLHQTPEQICEDFSLCSSLNQEFPLKISTKGDRSQM